MALTRRGTCVLASLMLLAGVWLFVISGIFRHVSEARVSYDEHYWQHRPFTEGSKAAALSMLELMTFDEKVTLLHGLELHQYVGETAPIERLGIPALALNDGPQGFRDPIGSGAAGTSTAFPCGLSIGSTWSRTAAFIFGSAMGEEFRGKGGNVQLGPGLNVMRIPRNGRAFEYLSGEDPFLGAQMAVPVVKGIQGQGVIACAKHYINNNQEQDRLEVNAIVDERTEMEIYLPPFEAAVRAGVGSVMCSYNNVSVAADGTDLEPAMHACENSRILNDMLKGQLGFEGWVMSDWGATHSTVAAANNGLDQEMSGSVFFNAARLNQSLEDGQISMAAIDDKVVRVLTPMFEMGLFDRSMTRGDLKTNVSSTEHNNIARTLAVDGLILLQNEDSMLPLQTRRVKTLAVIGDAALSHDVATGGGSGHVVPPYLISGLQGIQNVISEIGAPIKVVSCSSDLERARRVAASADVAIVFVADTAKENKDRGSLSLSGVQDELVGVVTDSQPNTVVVVYAPGPILLPWSAKARAIVLGFLPGQEAGNAVGQVIFGVEGPGGRLPITLPQHQNQYNFSSKQYPGVDLSETYSEELFVGYRWYHNQQQLLSQSEYAALAPLFPFGHGLAYTQFAFSSISVGTEVYKETIRDTDMHSRVLRFGTKGTLYVHDVGSNGNVHTNGFAWPGYAAQVKCTISNVGQAQGSAVGQLYLTFPASSQEPPRQLKGFQKVRLEPSESAVVTFLLTWRDLSVWDTKAGRWQVAHGDFTVEVGGSSTDLPLREIVTITDTGQIQARGALYTSHNAGGGNKDAD